MDSLMPRATRSGARNRTQSPLFRPNTTCYSQSNKQLNLHQAATFICRVKLGTTLSCLVSRHRFVVTVAAQPGGEHSAPLSSSTVVLTTEGVFLSAGRLGDSVSAANQLGLGSSSSCRRLQTSNGD
ncbi:unnamed protein product [Pleuronectes platessa]|uniref:Uncharacterized protein n=1 Tax=Pleuronectes platessa TaxID=8262 RepID=A0A9N7YEV3_PLEPL|nr:unnamed protein product [Pleuronectes platessa]